MARRLLEDKLRGVNFGGWLLLERWMTPGLFAETDARDEYEFMRTPGALDKLREHQRTFIREEDFRWLRDNGLNAVRIPVGYWVLDGDPPYRSVIGRLDWAVRMAARYDIRVLICLHGAPGSQNGHDHSGRTGKAQWYQDTSYRDRTIDVLARLAERYREEPAVWGVELLNEPLAWRHILMLRRFYAQAYARIRSIARPGLVTVFSDAFMPRTMSGALRAHEGYPVMMDTHWYHFFVWRHVQRIMPLRLYYMMLGARRALLGRLQKAQPIIVGEWSGVIGAEAIRRFPQEHHEALMREHLRYQLKLYDEVAGWFYWNYKTSARGIFHFRSMVEDGHATII